MPTKRVQRVPSSTRKPPPCAPAWVWLFAGILIGMFLSFLLYLREIVPHPATVVVSRDVAAVPESTHVKPESIKLSEPSTEPPPQTNFEFYEVLPKIEVDVPEDTFEEEAETNYHQPPPAHYILQVGAYRDASMAEGLKAHLASLGIQATIQIAEVNQQRVHRVQIGPSSDIDYLNDLRAQLAANHIESLIKPVP